MEGEPGFRLPGIEGLTFVADGGFSRVYRGYQTQFGRWVAVKVIHAVADPEGAARRLEREQLAMGRLSQHPNVVTVYHAGTLPNGAPYLLMDYLANGSLAQRLQHRGPAAPSQVARLGADIAAALATAHQLGVVHGDLKPANVLLGPDDQALLTDFGISELMDRTATGQHYLTPAFSAPEQRWQAQVLPASDLWSLGATMFVALTGEAPPQPEWEVVHDARYDVAAAATRVLNRVGTPPLLIDVVQRCLQVDVLSRPDARTVHQTLAGMSLAGMGQGGMGQAPTSTGPAAGPPHTPPDPVALARSAATGIMPVIPPTPTTSVRRPTGLTSPALSMPPPQGPPLAGPVSPDGQPLPGASMARPHAGGPARHGPNIRRNVLAALSVLVVMAAAALVVLRENREAVPSGAAGGKSPGAAVTRPIDAAVVGLAGSGESALADAGDQCPVEAVVRGDELFVVGYTTAARDAAANCCPASIVGSCHASARRHAVYRYTRDSGWSSADAVERADGRGSQEFHGILDTGAMLVAFGASWIKNEGDFAATAWRSADGQAWEQVFSWEPTPNDGQLQALIDAASNGTVLLAVGHSGYVDPAGVARSAGVVFVATPDARQWAPVSFPRSEGVVRERLQAVAWTGSGFLIGGTQALVGGGWVQVLWLSDANGENWQQVHRGAPSAFQEIAAIGVNGSIAVAVGPRENPESDGVVLRSEDGGLTWTEISVGLLSAPGHQNLWNLTVTNGWFVAAGAVDGSTPCDDGSPCTTPVVFASRDGLDWQPLAVADRSKQRGHQQATTAAVTESGEWYALGYEETDSDVNGRWWQLAPPRE
ncbi:MAG: protein kinase domain-containing protein [Acidimicrobiales bacterium]